jgi:hypothetical protein
MVAFGELASCMNGETSGVDELGLGRMTWMEFKGREGQSTMVLVGYVPCKNDKQDSGTSYWKHKRFFIWKEKKDQDPRARFLADLVALVSKWQKEGKNVVICLDANEDIYSGVIGKTLTDRDGLNLVEAVQQSAGEKMGATHFRGSKPPISMACGSQEIWRWQMHVHSRSATDVEIIA